MNSAVEDAIRAIVRDELANLPSKTSELDRSERVAVTIAEASRLVGYSGSFLRVAIQNHDLLPSYANSKAVIEIEELRRWVRSLPPEPPNQRRSGRG